jgi:hypothetical protein
MNWLVDVGALLIGLASVLVAVAWRLGRLHLPGETQYWDTELPAFRRNLIVSLLPLSISFGALLAMPLARDAVAPVALEVLGWIFILGAVLAMLTWYWPATWLKPTWLREQDRLTTPRRDAGSTSEASLAAVRREVPAAAWWTMWGVLVAFGAAIPVFHWPTSWFIAVVFGASALLRVHRRPR